MLPSPDILNNFPLGRFVLSNLAAKRAKQLGEGAIPLVHIDSRHPLTIALAEIAAGKIKAILPDGVPIIEDGSEVAALISESPELGMLLPALDEVEVALVTGDEILAEDEVEEVLESDDLRSLSDLVGEDEEAEVGAASDDDTLSLDDLAEQETGGTEEGEEEV